MWRGIAVCGLIEFQRFLRGARSKYETGIAGVAIVLYALTGVAGTLTIVGSALIDTGSRMDEVIFEEFKGTGNSEVTLDRLLAEKRIWPAMNIPQSGTRKEEKLFTFKEYEKVKKLRQMLFQVKPVEAMEALVKRLSKYTYNDEFLDEL